MVFNKGVGKTHGGLASMIENSQCKIYPRLPVTVEGTIGGGGHTVHVLLVGFSEASDWPPWETVTKSTIPCMPTRN